MLMFSCYLLFYTQGINYYYLKLFYHFQFFLNVHLFSCRYCHNFIFFHSEHYYFTNASNIANTMEQVFL